MESEFGDLPWEHTCPAYGPGVTIRLAHTARCSDCSMPRPGPVRPEPMKLDAGKPPVDLVEPGFVIGIARVLAFGAKKYAPNRWKAGMARSRVLAAAMRHLLARMGGEIIDADSGEPHLYCAACEIMFCAYYDEQKIDVPDDRFVKAAP